MMNTVAGILLGSLMMVLPLIVPTAGEPGVNNLAGESGQEAMTVLLETDATHSQAKVKGLPPSHSHDSTQSRKKEVKSVSAEVKGMPPSHSHDSTQSRKKEVKSDANEVKGLPPSHSHDSTQSRKKEYPRGAAENSTQAAEHGHEGRILTESGSSDTPEWATTGADAVAAPPNATRAADGSSQRRLQEASAGTKPVEEIASGELGTMEHIIGKELDIIGAELGVMEKSMGDIVGMKKRELGAVKRRQGMTPARAQAAEGPGSDDESPKPLVSPLTSGAQEEPQGATTQGPQMEELIVERRVLGDINRSDARAKEACADSDTCLQKSQHWGTQYHCATGAHWCADWQKDMFRCCPNACGISPLTETACNAISGQHGTCIYPNDFSTSCPAMGAVDEESIVGDPHVVNIAEQKFQIRSDGVHKLVQIPRFINSNETPDLRVDGEIQHLAGTDCNNFFMTSLSIFGRWTEEEAFGLLRITRGSDMPNTTLLINKLGPEEYLRQSPLPDVKTGRGSIAFKLRDVSFHVGKHFEGRFGRQQAYLNVRVAGLRRHQDVGGLLGYDDHTEAEKPAANCEEALPAAAVQSSFVGIEPDERLPFDDWGSRIEAE